MNSFPQYHWLPVEESLVNDFVTDLVNHPPMVHSVRLNVSLLLQCWLIQLKSILSIKGPPYAREVLDRFAAVALARNADSVKPQDLAWEQWLIGTSIIASSPHPIIKTKSDFSWLQLSANWFYFNESPGAQELSNWASCPKYADSIVPPVVPFEWTNSIAPNSLDRSSRSNPFWPSI